MYAICWSEPRSLKQDDPLHRHCISFSLKYLGFPREEHPLKTRLFLFVWSLNIVVMRGHSAEEYGSGTPANTGQPNRQKMSGNQMQEEATKGGAG